MGGVDVSEVSQAEVFQAVKELSSIVLSFRDEFSKEIALVREEFTKEITLVREEFTREIALVREDIRKIDEKLKNFDEKILLIGDRQLTTEADVRVLKNAK